MDRIIENIDKQIKFNQDKNILLDDVGIFQFSKETIDLFSEMDKINPDAKQILVDYASEKAIEEFCRINQYYSFGPTAKRDLKQIYSDLYDSLSTSTAPVKTIAKNHYEKLKKWLADTNPFAEKIYVKAGKKINPVTCSEYSERLQIELLKIDLEYVIQPVLDIGCGKNGYLVNYLSNYGIEVYGIDRYSFNNSNLITVDWLEYEFEPNKWGTLISNLGFSNHFNHHNLREDGNYIEYAKTYMNMLHSLKIGGRFHYAPDLPFIEKFLDNKKFSIDKQAINGDEFKVSIITRLQ